MANERSGFPQLMTKNAYKYFFEMYDRHEPIYNKIFRVEQSTGAYDQTTTAIKASKLREKKEGSEIVLANAMEGFTVYGKNRTFASSYEFTLELVEDTPTDKVMNILREVAMGWGEGVVVSKEEFAANFFNKGGFTAGHDNFNNSITGVITDPTGDLCYDGKPFFNLVGNTRTSKGGTTYYNGLALALSSTNLQTAYNLMTNTNNRNENDEVVAIKPDVLLIPPALRFNAKNVLEAERIVGSANNDINATQNLVQPIEWQYLTDTDAWFLGVAGKGLVWQERKQPFIEAYQDPKTKNYYVTIDARWGARMENWRYWVGSNFSTS